MQLETIELTGKAGHVVVNKVDYESGNTPFSRENGYVPVGEEVPGLAPKTSATDIDAQSLPPAKSAKGGK